MSTPFEIQALIVEDDRFDLDMICLGVEKYNKSQYAKKHVVRVVGMAKSYNEAAAVLDEFPDIKLILLDIEIDGDRDGLEIMRDFRDRSYLVVSAHAERGHEIFHIIRDDRPHDFIKKTKGKRIDLMNYVCDSLKEYVESKRRNFYDWKISEGNKTVFLKDVSFISKRKVKLAYDVTKKAIMPDEIDDSTDAHVYFHKTSIDPDSYLSAQIIAYEHIGGTDPKLSLDNLVERNNLDPSTLIRISKKMIVNFDHVSQIQSKGGKWFEILISGFHREKLSFTSTVSLKLPYSDQYISANDVAHLSERLSRRLSQP